MDRFTMSRRSFAGSLSMAAFAWRGRGILAQVMAGPSVVQTPSGTLRGETANGVRVFRGVPFAMPPVRDLRFKAPVKMKAWEGERDATRFAAEAMQTGERAVPKSEDCLYLNIWAPEGKGPFPVYVWIHGGGFTGGRAFDPIFDGSEFAREGIVCITVAYRLGVLGFLDVGPLLGSEYACSADNALRDLIASLEWVRENVGAFGGNPGHVTIGGESAGAKLIGILMGIPSARPLFSQMISESGGAERVWPAATATTVSQGFRKEWSTSTGNAVEGLRSAPVSLLIETQRKFIDKWPQHFPLRAQVDGSLLPQLPLLTISGGSTRGKRLLIGTNRDESALFVGPHPAKDAAAADLGNVSTKNFATVYSKYRTIYPQLTADQRRIRALTAEEYWVPSMRVVDAHLHGGGTAWMYRLDFAETSGRLKNYAFHSLDIGLAWNKPHANVENAIAEGALAKQVHAAWVTFIRGEAPAAPGIPLWQEYRSDSRPTMILDTKSSMKERPQESELRLWDNVL